MTVVSVIGGTPPACGQITMATAYVPNAVAFAKGQGWLGLAGTCASKGFSVKGGTKALPAALTGYTDHPLTAILFIKPSVPAVVSGCRREALVCRNSTNCGSSETVVCGNTNFDLSSTGGSQTTTSSADAFTYQFDLFSNINPLPDICNTYGVYGSCAVQYNDDPTSGSCVQIGPDLTSVGELPITRTPTGLNFKLQYNAVVLTVQLVCDKGAGAGKPGQVTSSGQAYQVEWKTAAVCSTRVTCNLACQHGGTCHGSELRSNCACPSGWTGKYCTVWKACKSRP